MNATSCAFVNFAKLTPAGSSCVSEDEGTERRAVEKQKLTSQHVFAMLEQLERIEGRRSQAGSSGLVGRAAVDLRFPARYGRASNRALQVDIAEDGCPMVQIGLVRQVCFDAASQHVSRIGIYELDPRVPVTVRGDRRHDGRVVHATGVRRHGRKIDDDFTERSIHSSPSIG